MLKCRYLLSEIMLADDIQTLIKAKIATSQLDVSIQGNHAHLVVVSDDFTGLSPVKKQQLVYGCLNDLIASGAVHAVHMQTFTSSEWAQKS